MSYQRFKKGGRVADVSDFQFVVKVDRLFFLANEEVHTL